MKGGRVNAANPIMAPATVAHLKGCRPLNTSTALNVAMVVNNRDICSVIRLSALRIKTGAVIRPTPSDSQPILTDPVVRIAMRHNRK
jgi:hypothetical protein